MTETYELIIGDWDGDEGDHRHVKFNIVGWKQAFNEDCSEYFEIGGICKPERAAAILEAVNAFQSLKDENERLRAALKRISELTPQRANAKDARDLHLTVNAIAVSTLARSVLQDGGSNG